MEAGQAGGDLGFEDGRSVGVGGAGGFALTGTDLGRMWIWLFWLVRLIPCAKKVNPILREWVRDRVLRKRVSASTLIASSRSTNPGEE